MPLEFETWFVHWTLLIWNKNIQRCESDAVIGTNETSSLFNYYLLVFFSLINHATLAKHDICMDNGYR